MKRNTKIYSGEAVTLHQVLRWADQQPCFLYLNGNGHDTFYDTFPHMILAGQRENINSHENSFAKLEELLRQKNWTYGFFSYDLKNEIETLESRSPATIGVEHANFAIPETIIRFEEGGMEIDSFTNPDELLGEIKSTQFQSDQGAIEIKPPKSNTSRKHYIENVNKIKDAIVEGEFYEMNYCIEYTAKSSSFDPLHCYENLNEISPMPFSVLMKFESKYLICASPERFLKKQGNKIISQPIKGTTKRSFDKQEDDLLKKQLLESEKERAENLMIVDLVRNDLAKSAETGSVKVEDLFGIYTFKRIHQMISTVSALHDPEIPMTDIIKNAFPMGSMTGAPKIRVMEEIDALETSARGLYSGAVGFFTPDGNFDFNVVIRSIIYDANSGQISFHVGSAITYDSDPEHEYNECLLKAESLFEVLAK
jgi:para-aminobenzoate synthetase component 1